MKSGSRGVRAFLREADLSGLLLYLLLAGLVALAIAQPYFEARAYERVTGAHVSYWDALWLDLRVQESPK